MKIKNILQKYNIKPQKKLGQNFIASDHVVDKIIQASELNRKDIVIEIGPGLGAITLPASKKAKLIIAIEKDARLCDLLKKIIKAQNIKNIIIKTSDILKTKLNLKNEYKIISNLPFNIAVPIIMDFLKSGNPPKLMAIILQKELAQKMLAPIKGKNIKTNKLAILANFFADIKQIAFVSKKNFFPEPKVDSMIITLKIKNPKSRLSNNKKFIKLFEDVVNAGFSHTRKQIINNLEKQLQRATRITDKSDGGILVITEGVFGMSGDQGKLKEILALKEKYEFRLFVDDAHGFGTIGANGRGTGEEQGVQDKIDIYFGTFAKSMASIGGFISGSENLIEYLRYNMRSQIFAKSMPMPLVLGALKRLELLRTRPELRSKLWDIANALQKGLRDAGFNLSNTNTQVTPVILKGTLGEATNLTLELREKYRIFCSIVVYPVVPKDVIMLRLIPTAVHTLEDVEYTIDTFKKIQIKLKAGEFAGEGITKWE